MNMRKACPCQALLVSAQKWMEEQAGFLLRKMVTGVMQIVGPLMWGLGQVTSVSLTRGTDTVILTLYDYCKD